MLPKNKADEMIHVNLARPLILTMPKHHSPGRALLIYQRKLAMAHRIEKDIILPGSIPHLTSQYVFGFEQD